MTRSAEYVRACRNFLLHRAHAPGAGRAVIVHHPERKQMADSFQAAGQQLSAAVECRQVREALTGTALIEEIYRLTGDIGEEDVLVLIRSNTVVRGLLSHPGIGGIPGLLRYCEQLPGARTETMIDPIEEDAFLRMYAIDFDELRSFVARLRALLEATDRVQVTCPLGTQVTLRPRHWIGDELVFELYTAPVEEETEGRIVYCGLSSPEKPALTATVTAGRITQLDSGEGAGKVTESLRKSLESGDACCRVVAELGIGTNPGSQLVDSYSGQMENETMRGTCHFDLGANTMFGGANQCEAHLMGLVWRPTISGDHGPILSGMALRSPVE